MAGAGDALQAGEHIKECAHVGRLFLYPDDVAGFAVAGEFGSDFFFREGIELFEKNDCGGIVFSPLALGAKLVTDLAGTDQDAIGFSDFCVGNYVLKIGLSKVRDGRGGVGMAQHAFGGEDDQRFTPVAESLAAEQMEILSGVRGLRDLDVVFRGELQEALNAGAGVFWSLAFVAVGKKQDEAGEREEDPGGFG